MNADIKETLDDDTLDDPISISLSNRKGAERLTRFEVADNNIPVFAREPNKPYKGEFFENLMESDEKPKKKKKFSCPINEIHTLKVEKNISSLSRAEAEKLKIPVYSAQKHE